MRAKQNKSADVISLPVSKKHNQAPIDWDSTFQVCQLLQEEAMSAIVAGAKISDLARRAHILPVTLSRIAYGETKEPRANTIINLLRVFGYKVTIS